ncbi:MAG: hypothetical protein PHU71_02545 [Candidatus Gracilibacteria bacterium]|nr:hypothetical protein [Candidatus Gracilibacteria bacterium]
MKKITINALEQGGEKVTSVEIDIATLPEEVRVKLTEVLGKLTNNQRKGAVGGSLTVDDEELVFNLNSHVSVPRLNS